MFETLDVAPPDSILGLAEAFKKEANPRKVNLSVGVYKNDAGQTPILRSVKEAEKLLLEREKSKGYLSIDGLPEYGAEVQRLLFADRLAEGRAVTAQTPGGTGALRVAADFLQKKYAGRRVWCSEPTWANHPSIFTAAGLAVDTYPYMDASATELDFAALLAKIRQIPAGDAICLHACCHNPSGIDPTAEQWQQLAALLKERGVLPLVDFAYQGFGEGLQQDAAGLRILLEANDEMLVCSSYSKNFGLYAERVGALTVVARNSQQAQAALSHVKTCIRANYSNPPLHGAAIVATVLTDPALKALWEGEVDEMRGRIHQVRQLFVDGLRQRGVQRDFSFITRQRGMFSFSGLNRQQVDALRSKYGIYVVGSGRINVAGMTRENIAYVCDSVAAVL